MSRPQSIAVSFAWSRPGRALLHLGCLLRGGNCRWHLRGIVRELFGRTPRRSPVLTGPGGAAGLCLLLQWTAGIGLLAAPAPAPLSLELLPAAQVDSAGVYLHQIVASVSAVPSRPIRLADAPAFGRAASLTREQIADALRRAEPALAGTAGWSGAPQIRLTRRARLLGEGELRELLTATLQRDTVKDRGELELRFSRPWAGVTLPDETLNLKVIDLPASGVSANFIVRFELSAGAERFGPWQAVVQGRIMKNVLMARTTLQRGQPLQESDFTPERRDVLALREPLDLSALANPSLELIENIPAGQPLLARSVRMRPVVQRGQMVDGVVRDGALNISLKVEVLADGQPGQLVRVRNPKTKREFYAKVQDEQTVVINL